MSQYLYLLVKVRTLHTYESGEIQYEALVSQYLYLLVKVRTRVGMPVCKEGLADQSQYLYLLVKVRTVRPVSGLVCR